MTDKHELLTRWMESWRQTENLYAVFLKRWDLTLNEYLVILNLLKNGNGMEPTQLADAIKIQRQLVTSILRGFERKGFISRQERSSDHRRRMILLTGKGLTFASGVCDAVDQLDLYGLSEFSEDEQQKLLEFSERFHQAILAGSSLAPNA